MMGKGNYEGAIERFQARIAKDPKFALAYCEIARAHANRGGLKEAGAWCEKAVKTDPLLAEAYYILALIRQEEGDYEKAVELLKKTLYLDPNLPWRISAWPSSIARPAAGMRRYAIVHMPCVLAPNCHLMKFCLGPTA